MFLVKNGIEAVFAWGFKRVNTKESIFDFNFIWGGGGKERLACSERFN